MEGAEHGGLGCARHGGVGEGVNESRDTQDVGEEDEFVADVG